MLAIILYYFNDVRKNGQTLSTSFVVSRNC